MTFSEETPFGRSFRQKPSGGKELFLRELRDRRALWLVSGPQFCK